MHPTAGQMDLMLGGGTEARNVDPVLPADVDPETFTVS